MSLETFRLYVGHRRSISESEERTLRKTFFSFGTVTDFFTRQHWNNSFVSFTCTRDAVRAKEALDGRTIDGLHLRVAYARPTRNVVIRGLPEGFQRGVVMRALQRWPVEVTSRGNDFHVAFDHLADAEEVVRTVNKIDGHEVSYDFGKEERMGSRPNVWSHSMERDRPKSCAELTFKLLALSSGCC
jgi:hypothetical protein